MLDAHNGLFAATFPVPTLVQMFLVVHCLWTGVMGVLCTWDPSFSPITENGVFKRDGSKDKILHPLSEAWPGAPVGGYHHPPHAHTSCENGGG